MRFVWLIALFVCSVACVSFDAVAQEGQKGGDSAEAAENSESEAEAAEESESEEEAARARRRRMRMGNVVKMEVGDKTIAVSYGETPTDGPDYLTLATIEDGDLVKLTKSIVTKLKTDLDLKFGDAVIKSGNVAKDYPGVYGLWLKRVDDGWHLVFNEYADVWGTQHFPDGDVAEVPLAHAKTDETIEKYTVKLEEADDGGTLLISWGDYQWTAAFTIAQ